MEPNARKSDCGVLGKRIPCTRVNRDTLSPYSGGCARRCCSPAVLELAPEAAMLADAGAPAVLAPALAAVVLALPAPPLRYALPLPLPPLSHQLLPLIHSFVVSARTNNRHYHHRVVVLPSARSSQHSGTCPRSSQHSGHLPPLPLARATGPDPAPFLRLDDR
jgi:hypothetical protein